MLLGSHFNFLYTPLLELYFRFSNILRDKTSEHSIYNFAKLIRINMECNLNLEDKTAALGCLIKVRSHACHQGR